MSDPMTSRKLAANVYQPSDEPVQTAEKPADLPLYPRKLNRFRPRLGLLQGISILSILLSFVTAFGAAAQQSGTAFAVAGFWFFCAIAACSLTFWLEDVRERIYEIRDTIREQQ